MITSANFELPESTRNTISGEIFLFFNDLLKDGERAAVILGASRIDVALENLLKTTMSHHPDGEDNLFDNDRPLGTFSAKISLAYRLGLIPAPIERSIQLLRRIRNEFAHSISKITLSESQFRNRINEMQKSLSTFAYAALYEEKLHDSNISKELRTFCISVMAILLVIETDIAMRNEFEIVYRIKDNSKFVRK